MIKNIPGSIGSNNLRVGKKYYVRNFGEISEFMILEPCPGNDFRVKDLLTLETYLLSHLTRYGIGKDFEMRELEY